MVCVLMLSHSKVLQIIMGSFVWSEKDTPHPNFFFLFFNQDIVMSLNWSGNRSNSTNESVVINNSLAA